VAFLPRLFSKRIVGFNFWSKFLRDGVQDFPGLLGRVLFRLRLWSVDQWMDRIRFPPGRLTWKQFFFIP
jgi:hypothetical protein